MKPFNNHFLLSYNLTFLITQSEKTSSMIVPIETQLSVCKYSFRCFFLFSFLLPHSVFMSPSSSSSFKPNRSPTQYSCKSPPKLKLESKHGIWSDLVRMKAQTCAILFSWEFSAGLLGVSSIIGLKSSYLRCLCQKLISITTPKQPATGQSSESPHQELILHSNHPGVHLIKWYFREI